MHGWCDLVFLVPWDRASAGTLCFHGAIAAGIGLVYHMGVPLGLLVIQAQAIAQLEIWHPGLFLVGSQHAGGKRPREVPALPQSSASHIGLLMALSSCVLRV